MQRVFIFGVAVTSIDLFFNKLFFDVAAIQYVINEPDALTSVLIPKINVLLSFHR